MLNDRRMEWLHSLAEAHIAPDPDDGALMDQYLSAAVAEAERVTGLPLTGRQKEAVFHSSEIHAPRSRAFFTPALGGHASASVMLPGDYTGPATVWRLEGSRWVRHGHVMAVSGVVNFLDRHGRGCCSSEGAVKVTWVDGVLKTPWPPLVVQGILSMTKLLYESRGDGGVQDVAKESGALKMWESVVA